MNQTKKMATHPFANLEEGKLETMAGIQAEYEDDESPDKISLMAGVYRTDQGQPFVLPAIQMARQRLFENPDWNHEYPPSHLGTKRFRSLSEALFFGEDSSLVKEERIASMQCLGASGACHMGAAFLRRHHQSFTTFPSGKVYIPSESWINHPNTFRHVGCETDTLPWYDAATGGLDLDGLLAAVHGLPRGSVVVLQTAGHNPTGCDPSAAQWRLVAAALARGGHTAFVDAAYPGFATGDCGADCAGVRACAAAGVPLLLAATFGKACGLYGERVGLLAVVLPTAALARRAEAHLRRLARAETGAQPAFGAALVEAVLGDLALRRVWEADLAAMAAALRRRRRLLRAALERRAAPGDWRVITTQVGMFYYTGFSEAQVRHLREEYHIYLQDTGRMAISSLYPAQIEHVAKSIDTVMRTVA